MQTTLPLVSIITPSYNQAVYLESTLRSVIEQNYPNLEYIVIDGGSQDSSLDIINRHANELAWWVSENDRGQANAINKGLRRSKGEIIAWLNSDDLYLPGTLYQAVETLQNNPSLGMVFGDALTIDAAGHPLNQLSLGNWGLTDLLRFRIICQPAVFMRREAVEKVGLLDEKYHYMLDHQLWLRIATQYQIQHTHQLWAAARHHATAKNAAQASKFSDETLQLLEWIKTNPDFKQHFHADHRQIIGGAYRLSARYLLDGGQAGSALQAYLRAFWYAPAYTMKHWHRMTYALLSLVGLQQTSHWYYRLNKPPDLSAYPQLMNWPGLALSS